MHRSTASLALRAHLHLYTSLTHCGQGSACSSGNISVGSVYGVREGIRCASHYQFVSSHSVTLHCGQDALRAQKHCEHSSACASSPIHFPNALRARLRALLLPLCPEADNHEKRCGHSPCARAGTTCKRPFVSTANTCIPSTTGDALRALPSCQRQPHSKKRVGAPRKHEHCGRKPACAIALWAKALRALKRCGQKPCARQNTLMGRSSALGTISGEKTWQKPRKATREGGHDPHAPTTHSLRAPPPLAQRARIHPRQHTRSSSW